MTAKNAVVSGTIYANSGVFNGTVYADGGEFNGAITATSLSLGSNAAASVSGAINLDKFYKLGNTVGGSNSSVTISTGGLLTAKNAVISGSVYATNGYFKGKVEADEGYFKGELQAAKGSFSGAITATSLYLGGTNVTEIPDTSSFYKIGDTVSGSAGQYGPRFSVSTAGLLTCKNAVVSGSVYATDGYFRGSISATDGYFSGKIKAADIELDNKAITFGNNGEDDALIISNGAITVDYIPKTVSVAAATASAAYGGYTWQGTTSGTAGSNLTFKATGNTVVTLPARTFDMEMRNNNASSQSTALGGILYITIRNNGSIIWEGQNSFNGSQYIGNTRVNMPSVSINVTNGTNYTIATSFKMVCTTGAADGVVMTFSTPGWSVLVPAAAPADKTQVKIGSNGMQIFLGNSFYLTAANRVTGSETGPIIVMAGKVNGAMKTIKLDSSGLVISQ